MKFQDVISGNPPLTDEELAQSAYHVGDRVKVVNMRGLVPASGLLVGPQIGDTGVVVGRSTSRITQCPYLVRGDHSDYEMYFGAENLRLWA